MGITPMRLGLLRDDRPRSVRALRFAIGVTIGLVFVAFDLVPEAVWIPITVAVVMSSDRYAGGVLKKSSQRAAATAIGCGLGLAVIVLPGPHGSAMILLVGAAASFAAGLFLTDARYSYLALYAGISLIIVVSVPAGEGVSFALWRIANIFIGGAIGLLVSTVVLPESARRHFLDELATTAQLFAEAISLQREPSTELDDLVDLEERIISSVRRQQSTLASARLESLGWHRAGDDLARIVEREREMVRHFSGRTPDENFERLAVLTAEADQVLTRNQLN
ncbi:MAG TPA: FUSC family protein [Actinomycetota bacterium]|nr:FUSC family protein [Actinomycetota bacterium]